MNDGLCSLKHEGWIMNHEGREWSLKCWWWLILLYKTEARWKPNHTETGLVANKKLTMYMFTYNSKPSSARKKSYSCDGKFILVIGNASLWHELCSYDWNSSSWQEFYSCDRKSILVTGILVLWLDIFFFSLCDRNYHFCWSFNKYFVWGLKILCQGGEVRAKHPIPIH